MTMGMLKKVVEPRFGRHGPEWASGGFSLVEVVVALLIFQIGVLGTMNEVDVEKPPGPQIEEIWVALGDEPAES